MSVSLPIVLKNITLVDSNRASPIFKTDLRIDVNGVITHLDTDIIPIEGDTLLEFENIYACIGLMDIGCLHGDPGSEHREDLLSLTEAATRGGFTALAPFPNTAPVIQSKTDVLYLKEYSYPSPVNIYPVGAITTDVNGRDFTEMIDMHTHGAVAFSDGTHSIKNSGVMLRALQYVKSFGGLIINTPLNYDLSQGGSMHEGVVSVSLGLTGIPEIAETLGLKRDIQLLEYAQSKLHVFAISSESSIAVLNEAVSKKLNISASTSVWHLTYTDVSVLGFDTDFKIIPPLRSGSDRSALINAVAQGTISFLTSLHTPIDSDNKDTEFLEAENGNISLQTAFALGYSALKNIISLEKYVSLWTSAPRQILNIVIPEIAVGNKAELTFFKLESWVFTKADIVSKSYNTPLIDKTLEVKIVGTCLSSNLRINYT